MKSTFIGEKYGLSFHFSVQVGEDHFEAEEPNQKWVYDVTYIGMAVGWLSLAAVLDLSSRRVVGWAMAARQDKMLVHQALALTVAHRKPGAGLLHHSDRGCQ